MAQVLTNKAADISKLLKLDAETQVNSILATVQ